jgi:DNA-binding MarR family transcriptional regulator
VARSRTERLVRGALLLNLNYAARLANEILEQEMVAVGVKPEFAGLLTEIRLAEPVRPTELVRRTGFAPATLYDYVERLLAEKLIVREPNPRDRRSHLIRTTPKGVRRVHGVSAAVRRAHERFRDELGLPLGEIEDAVGDLRFALERALNESATH